jgi:Ca2+/Na+ antiporter
MYLYIYGLFVVFLYASAKQNEKKNGSERNEVSGRNFSTKKFSGQKVFLEQMRLTLHGI